MIQHDGQEQIVVSSAGTVAGYNSADGKPIWTVGGLSGNSVPSPTAVGPYLFVGDRIPEFGSALEASQSNLCLKLDASIDGKHEVVWRANKAVCDYASPVVDGDCTYYLNNVGVLYCVSSVTGETQYTERLGTTCWATPIVAGDYVFFFGKDGKTQVISSGPAFRKVSTNLLWDPKNAPAPESYKEHQEGVVHGHGEGHTESVANNGDGESTEGGAAGAATTSRTPNDAQGESGTGRRGGPGGGMAAMLLKNDANADGKISAEELPAEFKEMMARVDLNKDSLIDAEELKTMEDSFRKRREGSSRFRTRSDCLRRGSSRRCIHHPNGNTAVLCPWQVVE